MNIIKKEYLTRHMKSAHPSKRSTQAVPSAVIPNQDTGFNPESNFDLNMFVDRTSSEAAPEGAVTKAVPSSLMRARTEAHALRGTKLPRKINLTYQHPSTSHIFHGDQCIQEKPLMVSTETSSHIPYVDSYVILSDNCELDNSPRTPLMTPSQTRNVLFEGDSSIPCYYTSEFRELYLNLSDGEDPLLVYLGGHLGIPFPNKGHWGTL